MAFALGLMLLSSATTAHAASVWHVADAVDKLAGTSNIAAWTRDVADDGQPFKVATDCETGGIIITITALDQRTEFKQTNTPNGSAIFMRSRLDTHKVHSVRTQTQYANRASVLFYDPDIAPLAMAKSQREALDQDRVNPWAKLLADATATSGNSVLAVIAGGTLAEFAKASVLRIEPTLSDGRNPLLTIDVADPAVRRVLRHCQAADTAALPDLQKDKPIVWFSPDPNPDHIKGTIDPSWAHYKSPQQKAAEAQQAQLTKQQQAAQATADRTFAGSIDGFTSALPQYIARAASTQGLDPASYQKEAAYLATFILQQFGSCQFNVDTRAWRAPQYEICREQQFSVSQRANPVNSSPSTRAIIYHAVFWTYHDFSRGSGPNQFFLQKASITVSFSRLSTEAVQTTEASNASITKLGIVFGDFYPAR